MRGEAAKRWVVPGSLSFSLPELWISCSFFFVEMMIQFACRYVVFPHFLTVVMISWVLEIHAVFSSVDLLIPVVSGMMNRHLCLPPHVGGQAALNLSCASFCLFLVKMLDRRHLGLWILFPPFRCSPPPSFFSFGHWLLCCRLESLHSRSAMRVEGRLRPTCVSRRRHSQQKEKSGQRRCERERGKRVRVKKMWWDGKEISV